MADLLRTWEAGLVRGDVYRPYFVPYVPGGGIEPWFLSWSTLVGAVSIAGSLLALAANVDGVLGLVERVRRLSRGSAVLSDTAVELEARQARPDVLYELLGRRPWAPADLAERLDTSIDNAIALLEVFGFEQAESGLWRRGTSSDAEFLRQLLDEIIVAGGHPVGSTGGGFEERVRYLIENGTRAPMPDWIGGEAGGVEDDDHELELSDECAGDEDWPDSVQPIACGCADADCVVTLTMRRGAQQIELVFSAPTNHFVVPSEELTMRAMRLEEGQ